MCYINEYACKISCLNTELNTTSAMNRTIEGLHEGCRVISCEFKGYYSEGGSMSIGLPGITGDPILPAMIIAIILMIALTFAYIRFSSENKEENKEEPEKEKKT